MKPALVSLLFYGSDWGLGWGNADITFSENLLISGAICDFIILRVLSVFLTLSQFNFFSSLFCTSEIDRCEYQLNLVSNVKGFQVLWHLCVQNCLQLYLWVPAIDNRPSAGCSGEEISPP